MKKANIYYFSSNFKNDKYIKQYKFAIKLEYFNNNDNFMLKINLKTGKFS